MKVTKRVYVKAIPGYPHKDEESLELHYTIYDRKQLPRAYHFLCQKMYTQIGLTQSQTDECSFILVKKSDVKSGYKLPVINDLTELNEHLAVEIPPSARVYPSGRHATAIPIVVMCVDNNGLKTMANRTCIRFDVSLKA